MAKWHCLTDPEAAKLETWEAWVTAMQVGCALFDSATATEGPVPCRIGSAGEVKNVPATGPTPYTHAGAWLTSVFLATICRENDRLDRLMRVPVSFLRESVPGGAVFDDYVYDIKKEKEFYSSAVAPTARSRRREKRPIRPFRTAEPLTSWYKNTDIGFLAILEYGPDDSLDTCDDNDL